MLLPRFSLRLLLGLTTVCGVFFLVVLEATRGRAWAIAGTAAVAGLLLTLFFYAAIFVMAWVLAAVWTRLVRRPVMRSPFAAAGPPPQLIPPRDVE
jgi:hypothetical protein